MRIVEKRRGYFHGTHKGYEIVIERDHSVPDRYFYIRVFNGNGHAYDGYAPVGIDTMADAKREAIRGACLDIPNSGDDR